MPVHLFPEFLALLRSSIHPHKAPLPHWRLREADLDPDTATTQNTARWSHYTVTSPWGGYDRTAWFRNAVRVPHEFRGHPVVLLVHLSEALLYVDGEPWQGVDRNHTEALLLPRARGGERLALALQAYSGRKRQPSEFCSAYVATLDPVARALHTALRTLEDLLRDGRLERTEAERVKDLLHRTILQFEDARPGSPELPAAIRRAHAFLFAALEREFPTEVGGTVHLLPHSHIDVVWLWTLKETVRKCGRTFSTALRLMDEFPEAGFMQSQAYLYDMTRRSYPSLYRSIRRRVREGRWEVNGATWVEPDCNIPNGESLVRQLLYGRRFFQKEFGAAADVLWLPDTFGYSWALPQILRAAGVRAFFTTKLLWNDTTVFPHNSFLWEGIDGTRILAHEPPVGLEGLVTPGHVGKSWSAFREQEAGGTVLQTFGYGDGGGGPTKEHLEAARTLRGVTGMPRTALGTVRAFFDDLGSREDRLPVWKGELYLEMHRGTYTTHAWVKRANRRAESMLYTAEFLAAAAHLQAPGTYRYPAPLLEGAWKKLLLNQFHDIVPGTAIADAYEDTRRDFEEIGETCEAVTAAAVRPFVAPRGRGRSARFTLVNPLGWERSAYVSLEVPGRHAGLALRADDGTPLAHQILSRTGGRTQLLCHVPGLPPFGFAGLAVEPAPAGAGAHTPFSMDGGTIRTPYHELTTAADGSIASLTDLRSGRSVFAGGRCGNVFQLFRDTPRQWEAWEIDPDYGKNPLDILRFERAETVENGPLRFVLRSTWRIGARSRIVQDLVLYHASPRIDFVTTAAWHEAQTLLKVAFPFAVPADAVTYEIQFGALERTSRPATASDRARYEVPGQQWADVSAQGHGVSLLNDCKYGYDADGATLRLTLIRSPHYPHPVEPWWLHDEAVTDQGEHRFTYALLPHEGDWRDAAAVRRARELNVPVAVVAGQRRGTTGPLFELSSSAVVVDAVKKAEDGDEVVLRMHEAHGSACTCTLRCGFRVHEAAACDLMEQPAGEIPREGDALQLTFRPFEIKTVKIRPHRTRKP